MSLVMRRALHATKRTVGWTIVFAFFAGALLGLADSILTHVQRDGGRQALMEVGVMLAFLAACLAVVAFVLWCILSD